MRLTRTLLNHRIELLEPAMDDEQARGLDLLGRLYNRNLGPVLGVTLHAPDVFDLSMYSTSCEHSPVGMLMPDLVVKAGIADSILIPGGGKGGTPRQPVLGALGEVAERLLAVLHFAAIRDGLLLATYEDLARSGRVAMSPAELPLFAPEQYGRSDFGYVPLTPDTPVRWLQGHRLLSGDPVLVPAQLVLIYYKHHPREARIAYPTTGGLAFHPDRKRAILHGLYEYIERDAINVRWYARLPPRKLRVDLDSFATDHLGLRFCRLSTAHTEPVQVSLATLDIPIPIVTSVAIDRSRMERAFLGGGGAWGTRERALSQALFELGQSRTALKFYRSIGLKDIRADSAVSEMTDFFDAAMFYGYRANLLRLDWYLQAGGHVEWDEVPSIEVVGEDDEEYERALDVVRVAGLDPIVFDLNADSGSGAHVTKVLIPELTQASIPSHPYLGHPRYYHLDAAGAHPEPVRSFDELNRDPVPFP